MHGILLTMALLGQWEPPAYHQWSPPAYRPAEQVPEVPDRFLYLIYRHNCQPCEEGIRNAKQSGVKIRYINPDRDPKGVTWLWEGCSSELGTPAWVLVEDGKPVDWWIGPSSPEGVRRMAAGEG